MIPCFFALDQYHYARWMSVRLIWKCYSSNAILCYSSNAILQAKNSFSTIRLDHCHEQHNKDLKVDWEMLRLTGDDVKHLRWMVYGSEVARFASDIVPASVLKEKKILNFINMRQTSVFQKSFLKHVTRLRSFKTLKIHLKISIKTSLWR